MRIRDMLFEAARNNNINLTKGLLWLIGGDVNIQDDEGDSLLHVAVLYRHYSLIGTLVRLGIKINVQNTYGWTPLHLAVLINDTRMVHTLLELCVFQYIKDEDGNLPIHLAAEQGYAEIVEALLDRYTVNIKSSSGFTPLHLAAEKGYNAVIETLFYNSVNIDLQDKEGNTALIIAAKNNHISTIKCLLEYGADRDRENHAGQTFSAFIDTEEIRNIVCEHGELSRISKGLNSFVHEYLIHKRKRDSSTPSKCSKSFNTLDISSNKSSFRSNSISMFNVSSSESGVSKSLEHNALKCQNFVSMLEGLSSLSMTEDSSFEPLTVQSIKRIKYR